MYNPTELWRVRQIDRHAGTPGDVLTCSTAVYCSCSNPQQQQQQQSTAAAAAAAAAAADFVRKPGHTYILGKGKL
jgi:hypothetical protein